MEGNSELFDLDKLGALVTKAVTLTPREGNPQPRVCETASGMINSIGLQNSGMDYFFEEALPFLIGYDVPLIVNVSETTVEDYAAAAKRLSVPRVSGLEINVSCPNVKVGGMAFGTDPAATRDVVQAVRESTGKPMIVKLSPNVTNIVSIAKAAYEAKADALSMINTVLGMKINPETGEPMIHGKGMYMGGLSGPCIKPVGVRCVYQVYKSGIPLPIIGMGGITNALGAIEYIRAGATAVAIGTETFRNPTACIEVIGGIESFMRKHKIEDINELRGKVKPLN
jgi:dihydroorotate dehydrogenase (NAD+) catalytic subunit